MSQRAKVQPQPPMCPGPGNMLLFVFVSYHFNITIHHCSIFRSGNVGLQIPKMRHISPRPSGVVVMAPVPRQRLAPHCLPSPLTGPSSSTKKFWFPAAQPRLLHTKKALSITLTLPQPSCSAESRDLCPRTSPWRISTRPRGSNWTSVSLYYYRAIYHHKS